MNSNNTTPELNNIYNLFQNEIENILTDLFNDDIRNNIQTTINNFSSRNLNTNTEYMQNNRQNNNFSENLESTTTNTRQSATNARQNATNTRQNTANLRQNAANVRQNATNTENIQNTSRYRTNSFPDINTFYNYNPFYTSYYSDDNININDYYNILNNIVASLNSTIYEHNNNIRLYQQNLLYILQELRYIRPRIFQSNNRNVNNRQGSRPTNMNMNSNLNSNINILRRHINIPTDITSRNNIDLLYFYLNPYISRQFNNSDSNTERLLTNNEIILSTRRLNYNSSMNESRCPISLEDFVDNEVITEIIGCGHIFKTSNLMNWLTRESNCPVCRYNLLNYVNNSTQNNDSNNSDSEPLSVNMGSQEPAIIASVEIEIDRE